MTRKVWDFNTACPFVIIDITYRVLKHHAPNKLKEKVEEKGIPL